MLLRPGSIRTGDGWAFELKYDGFRAIVSTEDGLRVRSRRRDSAANIETVDLQAHTERTHDAWADSSVQKEPKELADEASVLFCRFRSALHSGAARSGDGGDRHWQREDRLRSEHRPHERRR